MSFLPYSSSSPLGWMAAYGGSFSLHAGLVVAAVSLSLTAESSTTSDTEDQGTTFTILEIGGVDTLIEDLPTDPVDPIIPEPPQQEPEPIPPEVVIDQVPPGIEGIAPSPLPAAEPDPPVEVTGPSPDLGAEAPDPPQVGNTIGADPAPGPIAKAGAVTPPREGEFLPPVQPPLDGPAPAKEAPQSTHNEAGQGPVEGASDDPSQVVEDTELSIVGNNDVVQTPSKEDPNTIIGSSDPAAIVVAQPLHDDDSITFDAPQQLSQPYSDQGEDSSTAPALTPALPPDSVEPPPTGGGEGGENGPTIFTVPFDPSESEPDIDDAGNPIEPDGAGSNVLFDIPDGVAPSDPGPQGPGVLSEPAEPGIVEPDPIGPGSVSGDLPELVSVNEVISNPSAQQVLAARLIRRIRDTEPAACTIALPRLLADAGVGLSLIGADAAMSENYVSRLLADDPLFTDMTVANALVDQRQCAALDFLRLLEPYPASRVGLSIENTAVSRGENLVAVVSFVGGQHVYPLLVDDNGVVQDLSRFAELSEGSVSIDVPLARAGGARVTRQLLIVIAQPQESPALELDFGETAQTVFGALSRDTLSRLNFGVATLRVE